MTCPTAPRHPSQPLAPVTVISFGYGHTGPDGRPLPPPPAHLTIDVRTHFRDPHVNPALRHLTAADPSVTEAVMATPGIPGLTGTIVAAVSAFLAAPCPGPVTVAVGCVGGRHRSAVIAVEAARRLERDGITVTVTHRDISRPVIGRPVAGRIAGEI